MSAGSSSGSRTARWAGGRGRSESVDAGRPPARTAQGRTRRSASSTVGGLRGCPRRVRDRHRRARSRRLDGPRCPIPCGRPVPGRAGRPAGPAVPSVAPRHAGGRPPERLAGEPVVRDPDGAPERCPGDHLRRRHDGGEDVTNRSRCRNVDGAAVARSRRPCRSRARGRTRRTSPWTNAWPMAGPRAPRCPLEDPEPLPVGRPEPVLRPPAGGRDPAPELRGRGEPEGVLGDMPRVYLGTGARPGPRTGDEALPPGGRRPVPLHPAPDAPAPCPPP